MQPQPKPRPTARRRLSAWTPVLVLWMLLSLGLMWHATARAQANVCASSAGCWESPELAVQVVGATTSRSGGHQYVALNLRFVNKTGQPYSAAIARGSMRGSDNRGRRYDHHRVQGLPDLDGVNTRPDFSLTPGGSRQATLEWNSYIGGNALDGDSFTLGFVVGELRMANQQQVSVGLQHAVTLTGIVGGMGAAAAAAAPATPGASPGGELPVAVVLASPAPVAPAVPPAPALVPVVDPCKALSFCVAEGALVARVTQLRTMRGLPEDDDLRTAVYVALSNRGDKPITLAYRLDSGLLVDANGNPYLRHGPKDVDMIDGLAVAAGNSAGTHFVIEPGATRNVALQHRIERISKLSLVRRHNYDMQLLQLERGDSGLAVARDYLLRFRGMDTEVMQPPPRPATGLDAAREQQQRDFEKFRRASGS